MSEQSTFLQGVIEKRFDPSEAARRFREFSEEDQAKLVRELEKLQKGGAPSLSANGHGNGRIAGGGHAASQKTPRKSLQIRTNQNCTSAQHEFLHRFQETYLQRTTQSKRLAALHRARFADQRTPANFNIFLKELQFPITLQRADGAYIQDVDGNRYIDIAGDFGVNLFGHAPDFLKQALKSQIDKGWALSGRYEAIGDATELFCRLTGHDRVAFCQSGTEALMSAVRIARAYTDRQQIAFFNNSYHGHADIFLDAFTAGVDDAASASNLRLDYGSDEALECIVESKQSLAAVVIEPVQSECIDLQPVEFLKKLQRITAEAGIVLIFDEMITGFRVHPRGCQGMFGIEADLATYGKILGGGITAGAVAGRSDIMDWTDGGNWTYGDQSKPGATTFIAGTHTQNPLKMAATLAVLKELEKRSPELQDTLNRKTQALVEHLNQFVWEERIPVRIISFGSQFRFRFETMRFTLTQALFLHLLNYHGVRYHLHGNCFLTDAHTDKDIEAISNAVQECLWILKREGFFFEKEGGGIADTTASFNHGEVSSDLAAPLETHKEKNEDRDVPVSNLAAPQRAPALVSDVGKVAQEIKQIVGSFLELADDEFDIDDELAHLGVDSILMAKMLKQISDHLGIKISVNKLVKADSISAVAQAICDTSPEPVFPVLAEPSSDESSHILDEREGLQGTATRRTDLGDERGSNVLISPLNGSGNVATERKSNGHSDWPESREPAYDAAKAGEIAIIGMSLNVPGAADPDQFWENLCNERVSIDEIPSDRWKWQDYYSVQGESGGLTTKWGGFLDGHDKFDPLFFEISPREAKYLDPQERLLLMQTYRAVEDSALNMASLRGTQTGVFVGYEFSEYATYVHRIRDQVADIDATLIQSTGCTYNLANRISFAFDWRGPSETFNVNCASSAVAINRAIQSLQSGESDLSIAGGVCLNLLPEGFINASDLLSPDGSSRIFDENANGFTKGEGCVVFVLKRLHDALTDNDEIYAVLKGSFQSNRGRANSLSDIRSDAIADVIKKGQERAGVVAESIRYIEIDGYGTKWGDSVEYEGIKQAMAGTQSVQLRDKSCGLGSLKSNIGHLEPASGAISLAKVALAMAYREFPPTVGVNVVNDEIDIASEDHPLYLLTERRRFEDMKVDESEPLRAGVNSFANTGVNVHMIVQEAPERLEIPVSTPSENVFILSARTKDTLKTYARLWKSYLEKYPHTDWDRVCYTLQTGREHHKHRFASVATDISDVREALSAFADGDRSASYYLGEATQNGHETGEDVTVLSHGANHLEEVAAAWVRGEPVAWPLKKQLKGLRPLNRLPTYPFALKRYWLDPAPMRTGDIDEVRLSEPVKTLPQAMAEETVQQTKGGSASVDDDAVLLDILVRLRSLVKEFLEIEEDEEINEAVNFSEIGLTSVSIVLFIEEINNQFGLELPETAAFDFPNLVDMAKHIAELCPEFESVNEPSEGQGKVPKNVVPNSDLDEILADIADETMSVDEALKRLNQSSSNMSLG